jgi:copper homeostasis protein
MLEVEVTTARQALRAGEAGADRVIACREHDFGLGSPTPDDVAAIRRATTVELRVLLRLRAGYGTDGGEATRLKGLIWSYLDAGADGFVLGFLNELGHVDQGVCAELIAGGVWPWTFDRAIDSAFDQPAAWSLVAGLDRCDGVLTAGSPSGLEAGFDHVLNLAADPVARPLLVVDRPLVEQVPWLTRAGVKKVNIGLMGRDVDSDRVASWRRLLP